MTREDEKQVEEVLAIWFRWQERESSKEIMSHFYPATDRSCGFDPDAVRGGQENGHDYLSSLGETVDALMDKLSGDLRAAVFTVMRNRSGAPQVWRTGRVPDFKLSFHEAKVRLFGMMVEVGVIELARDLATETEDMLLSGVK
ncbi:hypothetical protein ACQUFY_20910 [Robbsia andropogonis]|uniref:hypothetical protein n=1 Tax=Robbsia andropogonis TaxID=28092 RepID=UPI003D214809